jgi:hypothetical protein
VRPQGRACLTISSSKRIINLLRGYTGCVMRRVLNSECAPMFTHPVKFTVEHNNPRHSSVNLNRPHRTALCHKTLDRSHATTPRQYAPPYFPHAAACTSALETAVPWRVVENACRHNRSSEREIVRDADLGYRGTTYQGAQCRSMGVVCG